VTISVEASKILKIQSKILNLGKSNYQRRSIKNIKNSTSSVASDQNAILHVLKDYFEKFYQKVSTAEGLQIDEYLFSVQTPCLSESKVNLCWLKLLSRNA